MPLDPRARDVLDTYAANNLPPLHTLSVEAARDLALSRRAILPVAPTTPVARVEDRAIPGPAGDVPVRVYWPEGDGPFPILVYFHGGGWVICNLDTHDGVCRNLTNAAGCLTVSVDYRLAPEHPFPAGLDDCYAVTRWASENAATLGGVGPSVAVSGDSAGGNLAAAVALRARDHGGPPITFQHLIYPVTDGSFETASYRENAVGYGLERSDMIWFWQHYAPGGLAEDPLASPLRAVDLSRLPPALIQTAEFDPLRDEAEAYAARLRAAGVRVQLTRYDGMLHGFFGMPQIYPQAGDAIAEAGQALRQAFRG